MLNLAIYLKEECSMPKTHSPRRSVGRQPNQMPELIPLDTNEQQFSEFLLDVCTLVPISKVEPSHTAKETHFFSCIGECFLITADPARVCQSPIPWDMFL